MDDTTDRLDLDAIRQRCAVAVNHTVYDTDYMAAAMASSEDVPALLAEVARLRAERDTLAAERNMWADAFERLVKQITDHLAEHSPEVYKEVAPIVRVVLAEVDRTSRVVLAEHAEGQ